MTADSQLSRRPLKVRQRPWAIALAAKLARLGVAPRFISLCSFIASAIGAFAFLATTWIHAALIQSVLFLLAAVMMQLRLVCNLLDGMVAVEGGRGTPDGELYNDLPDRASDWALFLGVGYSVQTPAGVVAGWTAAMMAVLTAYVRVLGRASGAGMHFEGPMAKQQCMALMCTACVIAAAATHWKLQGTFLMVSLQIVIAGSLWTIVRRLRFIAGICGAQNVDRNAHPDFDRCAGAMARH